MVRAAVRELTHASTGRWCSLLGSSHFPVFIKTQPIKFYLQSIIRTPQINQRQLNQCFPGLVPGPPGPYGHSIFSTGLIHGSGGGAIQQTPRPANHYYTGLSQGPGCGAPPMVALYWEAYALISLTHQCRGETRKWMLCFICFWVDKWGICKGGSENLCHFLDIKGASNASKCKYRINKSPDRLGPIIHIQSYFNIHFSSSL